MLCVLVWVVRPQDQVFFPSSPAQHHLAPCRLPRNHRSARTLLSTRAKGSLRRCEPGIYHPMLIKSPERFLLHPRIIRPA
jgi:hypothetical protein